MRIYDCVQGSEEWYKIKCGVPSASNFDKIITSSGDPSKQAQKYLYRLAGEFVTGVSEETFQNANMLRGNELESEARNYYEMINDTEVKQVGFIFNNPDIEYGCSPDGLVGDDGMIQIKCPLAATHVGYLLDNKLPLDYFVQTQSELFVTGREWNDFMSYCPRMKPLIVRVKPDKEFHRKLKVELELFCSSLKEIVNKIK